MKTETCKLYSRDFWIFLPNIIKIDPYNFELYRFKVGPFFETQCRTKHEVYRITRCGDMAIRVSWEHMEPQLGGRGGRRESAMASFERAMVISYRLSIVTVALSVTIRPQFAIECLRRSNQQRGRSLGPKFPGVLLGVDHWCLGLQRANIPG